MGVFFYLTYWEGILPLRYVAQLFWEKGAEVQGMDKEPFSHFCTNNLCFVLPLTRNKVHGTITCVRRAGHDWHSLNAIELDAIWRMVVFIAYASDFITL
jgi:hypothetical protein